MQNTQEQKKTELKQTSSSPENKLHQLDDNSYLINEFYSYDILNPNILLYLSFLLSSYLFYQKIQDNFLSHWQAIFYPLYIYFIINLIRTFLKIFNYSKETNSDIKDIQLIKLRIENLSNIILISYFFKFVLYIIILCIIYNAHTFLDKRKDEYLIVSIQFLIFAFIWLIFYYLIRKLKMFKFISKLHQSNESTFIVFFSSLLSPILTYTSNLLIICSGGGCTQIYLSTITSLLGAFGVTLTNISEYLFPITCVLTGISLFSLYIKRKKLTHKPFILGCFSAAMIIIGKYFDKTKIRYICYPGNILMVAAAIWNAKLNKFSGIPRF